MNTVLGASKWLMCALSMTHITGLATYKIGVGIADVTGPPVGIIFMGYGSFEQNGQGIHLRQFSRAFIMNDGVRKMAFVSVDASMIGNGLRKEVLKRLKEDFGDLYTEKNVMISATHSHSTPGGFLMDFLFDASCLGFVSETFQALVKGITLSIIRAHRSQQEGRIFMTKGILLETNINRSPTAYTANPQSERSRYRFDVDKQFIQLKFLNRNEEGIGMIAWFAVHPTSMNKTNSLISSDNMGYASVLFEKQMNPKRRIIGKGPFVAAFASSNLGDASPNIMGPRCQYSGVPCDAETSKCPGNKEHCVALGPGKNHFESTRIIAERLCGKALELWKTKGSEVIGPLNSIHQFVHMPSARANYTDPKTGETKEVKGCLPAMGQSFAAGTIDGPGLFSFKQGQTEADNNMWNTVINIMASPSEDQIRCHGMKPILLTTGEINFPYGWQPQVVSTQLARIGNIAIACVPGEFTTMSGRRLRTALRNVLTVGEDSDVIIAGLCNTYSDYIATPEEYSIQRYEGASTIFGPYTLPLYINQYEKLASMLGADENDPGPDPPDFSSKVFSFVPPVMFDLSPWRKEFGNCIQQPPSNIKIGNTLSVKFVSGHPRNDIRHESTYLTVELFEGNWIVIATDANWETLYVSTVSNVDPQ